MKPTFILFFSFIFSLSYGQELQSYDHVYAKGGSFFRGIILDTVDNALHIQLAKNGALVLLPMEAVKTVKKEKQGLLLLKDGLKVQGTGRYHSVSLHYMGAKSSIYYIGNRGGLGIHYSSGHYLKPWLAVGAGLGLDVYPELIVPVFGEAKVFLNSIQPAPYFSMQAGYGFAAEHLFAREDFNDTRGGLMWYPSIGFRFASRRSAELHVDMGYKFQNFTFEQNFPDAVWGYQNITEKIRFQSFVIRATYLF